MLKTFVAGAAALLAGALSACGEVPQSTVTYMHPNGAWGFFDSATARGPLLLAVHGLPVEGSDAAAAFDAVATGITRSITRKRIAVTADAAAASVPQMHSVWVFNPPGVVEAGDLCAGRIPPTAPPSLSKSDERLRVQAVFCGQTGPYASVQGHIPRPDSLEDPKLHRLISQMTLQVFEH